MRKRRKRRKRERKRSSRRRRRRKRRRRRGDSTANLALRAAGQRSGQTFLRTNVLLGIFKQI